MRACWDTSVKTLFLNKNQARSPLLRSPPINQDSQPILHPLDEGSSQQLSLAQAGKPQVQDPDPDPNPMKYTRALAPIPHFLHGAKTRQPTHTTTDLPQDTQQARGNSDLGVTTLPGS